MWGIGNAPSVSEALYTPELSESGERIAESFVAYAELGAQVSARQRPSCGGECVDDGSFESERVMVAALSVLVAVGSRPELEVHGVVADEDECEGVWSWCAAVLDGEQELTALTAHVEQRIGPREEVARAAQALTWLRGRAILARVVDDHDGEVELALQLAQVAEQRGDLSGIVLVDAMQPYEGVKHE